MAPRTGLSLALAAGLVVACARGGGAVEEPAPAATDGPTVADIFGINEAISITRAYVFDLSEAERTRGFAAQIGHVRSLGVRHVRVHTSVYPYLSWHAHQERAGDTRHADAYMAQLLEAGLEPLVMLSPLPGNKSAATSRTYTPADVDAYLAWVGATVERYDGDGVDDAPGLVRGVHLWEVDNEPDLKNTAPPKNRAMRDFDPSGFCTAAEYAALASRTAAAIRAADPGATVLPGGLFWPQSERGAPYARALYREHEVAQVLDGINVHMYTRAHRPLGWGGVDAVLGHARAPVWITEVSSPSLGQRGLTERTQAADLATLYLEGLRRGVVRIYWHSLEESVAVHDPGFQMFTKGRHLLIGAPGDQERRADLGGVRRWTHLRYKLSAWVLRDLIAWWGPVPRSSVSEVPATGGRALALGEDVVVFDPDRPRGGSTVTVEVEGAWTATGVVPDEASGDAVRGEPTRLSRELRARGGRLEVQLLDGPVVLRPTR